MADKKEKELFKITAEQFAEQVTEGTEFEVISTGEYKDSSLEDRVRAIVTDLDQNYKLEVLVHTSHAPELKAGMKFKAEYGGTYVSPRSGRSFINTEAIWKF